MAEFRIRTALTLVLLSSVGAGVGPAHAARPAPPPGSKVLSAGQLPRACTAADVGASPSGTTNGTYFDEGTEQWMTAPFCFPIWGNLRATPPQVANAGSTVAVTAIPTDGSNSGTYAPQTSSIQWVFGGKRISGCGASDLTCSFVAAARPAESWQWVEVKVSMPRTFFIDSRGSNCAGLHICAGFTTNAWSWIAVRPKSLTPGILRGRVVDGDGDPMPGVRISASGPATRSTATAANGRYELPLKRAGRYSVKASNGAGVFAPRTAAVRISKGVTSKADFRLSGCSAKASVAKRRAYVGRAPLIGRFTATWDDCEQDVTIDATDARARCTDGIGPDTGDVTSAPTVLGSDFITQFNAEWSFKATADLNTKAFFSSAASRKAVIRGREGADGSLSPLPGIALNSTLSDGAINRASMTFNFDVTGGGSGPNGRTLCRFADSPGLSRKVKLSAK